MQQPPTDPRAPPVPDKYTRIEHDAAGRIVATEAYSGTAAASARGWEGWVRSVVEAQITTVYERLHKAITIMTKQRKELGVHLAEIEARIAELERQAGSRQPREEFDVAAD